MLVIRRLVVVTLCLGMWLLPTFALEISQIEFDLQVPAGERTTFTFNVHNDDSLVDDVRLYLAYWDRDAEGNHGFYDPQVLSRSNTAWISIAPSSFTLQPDESQEVQCSINVPSDAAGSYWGMIMVEGQPRLRGQAGATVMVVPRFGVKIYETPPDTGLLDGRVMSVERLGLNPLAFRIGFENTGTTHLTVTGEVQLIDITGEVTYRISVERFPVLPGGLRQVEVVSQNGALTPGRYLALVQLDFGNPDYLTAGQLAFEIKALQLIPIGESVNLPRDLDGDGLYEDINGDGKLADDDLALLGFHVDSEAVQENARAFDFDNDGAVDFNDVVALKGMVEEQ